MSRLKRVAPTVGSGKKLPRWKMRPHRGGIYRVRRPGRPGWHRARLLEFDPDKGRGTGGLMKLETFVSHREQQDPDGARPVMIGWVPARKVRRG